MGVLFTIIGMCFPSMKTRKTANVVNALCEYSKVSSSEYCNCCMTFGSEGCQQTCENCIYKKKTI